LSSALIAFSQNAPLSISAEAASKSGVKLELVLQKVAVR
jgi:hypothetical protein